MGPKAKLTEFRITKDAIVPVGTEITVRHFVPGQYLDIQGISYVEELYLSPARSRLLTARHVQQGQGLRWRYEALELPRSLGNTRCLGVASFDRFDRTEPGSNTACLICRSHSSTQWYGRWLDARTRNQTPGKVWKGKKMPGRMGGETCTMKNLYLWKIDVENNLLYVKGAVPGPKRGWLRCVSYSTPCYQYPTSACLLSQSPASQFDRVRDAKNKPFLEVPPFPAFIAPADEVDPPKVLFAKMQRRQGKIGAFTEEEKEIIRSSPNYGNMAPVRDETEKEKAFKGYRLAEFVEGE